MWGEGPWGEWGENGYVIKFWSLPSLGEIHSSIQ